MFKDKMKTEPWRKKLYRHVSKNHLIGAVTGMFIILLFATPVYSLVQYAQERLLPTSYWFTYQSLVPTHPYFKEGETVMFYSEAHYHRRIRMQWADNLVCRTEQGNQKLQTQVWPPHGLETREPGHYNRKDDPDREAWAYSVNIPKDAEACFLEARAVGYTPNFNIAKEWSWTTPWFDVNR